MNAPRPFLQNKSSGIAGRALGMALLLVQATTLCHASGTVVAWGADESQQCQVPAGLSNVVAVAGGESHSLALRGDGIVRGWGFNLFGQATPPAGLTNVSAITAGASFSVALTSNRTVTVWGNLQAQPAGLTNVIAISAGKTHCLALKADGTVISWGSSSNVPPGLNNVVSIAAGNGYSLALKSDSTVTVWGTNSYTVIPNLPSLTNILFIAAGADNALAVRKDLSVLAWGRNDKNQATIPAVLTNAIAVGGGALHSVALRADGSILAWGDTNYNQTVINSNVTGFISVAAGGYHSLAIKGDNFPSIVLQPYSQDVVISKSVTLTVIAAGAQPLTYQWQRYGTNLLNRTNASVTLSNFQLADSGHYSVLVANSFGSISSAPAYLNAIGVPPWFILQPQTQAVFCGLTATLRAAADGPPPIRYQWQFQGVPIAGATTTTLSVSNVDSTVAGPYTLVATNVYGATTSSVAILTVLGTPTISSQPTNVTLFCGERATFRVAASGPAPLSYQWQLSGAPLPGATGSTLVLNPATPAEAGPYTVEVACPCGSVTSDVATLTVNVEPPLITSPLAAAGTQGLPFSYTITGKHVPTSFAALYLPGGLSVNTTNGLISGIPQENGTFGATIATFNTCSYDVQTLVLTITSSVPVITSAPYTNGIESLPLNYQITATQSPTSYSAQNLPVGLMVDSGSGSISGSPVLAGEYDSTIFAANQWGAGSANLHFSITNAVPAGLSIDNVSYNYSSPYLLDFEFSLRDNNDPIQGSGVLTEPRLLSAVCMEDGVPISSAETAQLIDRGSSKLLKAYLVLDFTDSIASLLNGDTNNDGISDAVDNMVSGAQYFVDHQAHDAQIGVYEFHREDFDPQQVVGLSTDKRLVDQKIAGIWTNYVQGFSASSRCWDALVAAIKGIGTNSPYEQHYAIFVSDGVDESSTNTVDNVISLATNNNVRVYAIGFGNVVNAATLQNITDSTGGRFYQAATPGDLWTKFSLISKDLQGQYILRWATLKRTATAFVPSFQISFMGLTADFVPDPIYTNWTEIDTNSTPPVTNSFTQLIGHIPADYMPTNYGPPSAVVTGAVRLEINGEVQPTGVTLRAHYIPRYIRQMRFHYQPNWPCTATLESNGAGEILEGWSLVETNDGTGGRWLVLTSPDPANSLTSIRFAAFGPLVTFTFNDVINSSNAFSFFTVDNSLYPTNVGSQKFVLDANSMVKAYPVLPYGTPVPWLLANVPGVGTTSNAWAAAELTDTDKDGVPNWQEYRANTNPNDKNSKLFIRSATRLLNGRWQLVFPSSINRTYRVEASLDLVSWQVVQDKLVGNNADITVTDTRYVPAAATNQYYRVMVY